MKNELIVDNFAGGGGASTGIELATGRPVDIAINHDPDAIAMHRINHPNTRHYCESVWDVDPVSVCGGKPVGLMWLSPDCKHFSRAKGGKPVSKNIRGLAWIALRWAATVWPRVIMLENVPEFVTWGRLDKDGKPDLEHTGETFRSFVHQLRGLGYAVEWQDLKACDYGAPTIRKRFFLIARCDGKPIVFPKPTHGEGLIPYRTAAECIDWSIPCRSIFGREKPLADNTMRRIARGLDKFTIKADKPFIITCNHGGDGFRGSDIDKPLNVVTAKCSDGIVMPHISKYFGGIVGSKITDPLGTVTAVDHNALVSHNLAPYIMANNTGNLGAAVTQPLPTITTGNRNFCTAASLIQYHTEQNSSEVRGQALGVPIMTVDASPRYALAAAHIVKYYSGKDQASAADVDNCHCTLFGAFAPNSKTAEAMSQNLGKQTVLSGTVTRSSSRDGSNRQLQMIERPLMTVDELKSMPKGHFIVMKTGCHPMKTRLKLFFKWGIQFEEAYSIDEKSERKVQYVDSREVEAAVLEKFPPKPVHVEFMREFEDIGAGEELSGKHSPKTRRK